MTARQALLLSWIVFAVILLALVILPAFGQSPTLCANGLCVLPQDDLLTLLRYLQQLQAIVDGKCI